MRDIRNRSLVTALVPALLLTASLSLPAAAASAPAAGAKAVAADKADKQNNKKKKNQKQARQPNAQRRGQAKAQQPRPAQQQKAAQQQAARQQRLAQQQAARQQRLAQQQAAAQQRAARQQQAARQQRLAEQQAQQRAVSQRQQAQRLEAQRRAERQHQAELARQSELRRQEMARRQAESRRVQVQQNRNRYYGGRYDNSRDYGWRYGEQLHVDGFLIDADRDCLILRDHNGRTFGLVGGTGGLDVGDHAQLRAVVTEDYCDAGSTLEVREVKTVWEGDRHDRAWYYYQRDGSFGRFADRARGNDSYSDDRYYDDRYDDRYDDIDWEDQGDLMSVTGRLQPSGQCTILDTGGRDYALVGDLRGHDRGDKVKVIGVPGNGSRCGRQVLEIGEITRD